MIFGDEKKYGAQTRQSNNNQTAWTSYIKSVFAYTEAIKEQTAPITTLGEPVGIEDQKKALLNLSVKIKLNQKLTPDDLNLAFEK